MKALGGPSKSHPAFRRAPQRRWNPRHRVIENSMATTLTPTTNDVRRFAHDPPHCASEASSAEIARLYAALDLVNEQTHPRTAYLIASGVKKMAQKVMEEAAEVAIEGVRRRRPAVVRESADLIYNLVVLWHELGVAPDEIWAEMNQRATDIGIAEKAPKRSKIRFQHSRDGWSGAATQLQGSKRAR
jgi:phosphoribosyl-ATP pyrophosphohydrolase